MPRTEVLIFTTHDSETLIEEVLRAGARGYLLKSDATRDLIDAVAFVATQQPFFTSKVTEVLLEKFLNRPDQPSSTLTSRERVVVQLIAEGHSNKRIASVLSLSVKTVETHRAAVMRKLKLSSPAALVLTLFGTAWCRLNLEFLEPALVPPVGLAIMLATITRTRAGPRRGG